MNNLTYQLNSFIAFHNILVRKARHTDKYDIQSLLSDSTVADLHTLDISNRFQALSLDEGDVESQWTAISSAIRESADKVVGRRQPTRKP